jgi:hypothetical protein
MDLSGLFMMSLVVSRDLLICVFVFESSCHIPSSSPIDPAGSRRMTMTRMDASLPSARWNYSTYTKSTERPRRFRSELLTWHPQNFPAHLYCLQNAAMTNSKTAPMESFANIIVLYTIDLPRGRCAKIRFVPIELNLCNTHTSYFCLPLR